MKQELAHFQVAQQQAQADKDKKKGWFKFPSHAPKE